MATAEEEFQNILLGLVEAPAPEGVKKATDKQVADNARALASGDVPEGINMEALLSNLVQLDMQRTEQAQALNDQMTALSQQQATIAGQVTDTLSKLTASRQESLQATEEQIDIQGQVNQTVLNRTLELDTELQALLDAKDSQDTMLRQELDDTFEQMVRDFELVEANDNLNIFSVIQNPIEAFKTTVAARDAKQRLATNKDKIAVIDTHNQQKTRMLQQKYDSYNIEKGLLQLQHEDLYARQNAINTAVLKLNNKNANYTEVLGDLQVYFGLSKEQVGTLESQFRSLAEQGRLSANTVEMALRGEQTKLAKLQYEEARKLAAQNEATQALFDAKFKEIGRQIGLPELDSLAAWQTMVDSDLVSDTQLYRVQKAFASGTFGAAVVWNADKPSQVFSMLVENSPETLPPKMLEFMSTIENRSLVEGQPALNKTPQFAEDPEKARDNAIRNFRSALEVSVEPAVRTKLVTLQSPHNMDLTRIPELSPQVVEFLKDKRFDTTSMDAYITSAGRLLLDEKTTPDDIRMYSEQMSAITKYQRDMWNRETGLGLQAVRAEKFRNPMTGQLGDATNPADWYRYLSETKRITDINRKLGKQATSYSPLSRLFNR